MPFDGAMSSDDFETGEQVKSRGLAVPRRAATAAVTGRAAVEATDLTRRSRSNSRQRKSGAWMSSRMKSPWASSMKPDRRLALCFSRSLWRRSGADQPAHRPAGVGRRVFVSFAGGSNEGARLKGPNPLGGIFLRTARSTSGTKLSLLKRRPIIESPAAPPPWLACWKNARGQALETAHNFARKGRRLPMSTLIRNGTVVNADRSVAADVPGRRWNAGVDL